MTAVSGDRGQGEHSWPGPARAGFGASQASDQGRVGQGGWRGGEVGADPAYRLLLAALGTLEFTLLFDADNSALHCTAHRAKVRMRARVCGRGAWATDLPRIHCLFSGSQATSLRLCGHLRQSQYAARSQQGEGETQAPTDASWPHPSLEHPPGPAVAPLPQSLAIRHGAPRCWDVRLGTRQGGEPGWGPGAQGRPDPPSLAPRPASCGPARFGAQGGPSGRRPSPITASPARMLGERRCGEGQAGPGLQGGRAEVGGAGGLLGPV